MLRRARIALALFALSTLCAAPAAFAEPANDTAGGDLVAQFFDWLAGVVDGGTQQNGTDGDEDPGEDEFNPQHLPGG
jgi:hypothetical protein